MSQQDCDIKKKLEPLRDIILFKSVAALRKKNHPKASLLCAFARDKKIKTSRLCIK